MKLNSSSPLEAREHDSIAAPTNNAGMLSNSMISSSAVDSCAAMPPSARASAHQPHHTEHWCLSRRFGAQRCDLRAA